MEVLKDKQEEIKKLDKNEKKTQTKTKSKIIYCK